jgi:hypothetical protein
MTKKWIAINVLLLAVTGLLARQLRVSVQQFQAENNPAKIQPARSAKQPATPEKPPPTKTAPRMYAPGEFSVIAEKVLFVDTRGRMESTEVAAVPETPPLTQKPILVGTTIMGDRRLALIVDPTVPAQGQARSRRTQTKRIGDSYQGYTITSITEERIVLEAGTRREIIPLHEGPKRSQAGKTAILATRVVPVGAGGTATAATAVAGGSVVVSRPATPSQTPVTTMTIQQPAQTQGRQATPGAKQPPATTITIQPSAPTQMQIPPGARLVQTPFGDVIREVPQPPR